jgi:hypothetical protein
VIAFVLARVVPWCRVDGGGGLGGGLATYGAGAQFTCV